MPAATKAGARPVGVASAKQSSVIYPRCAKTSTPWSRSVRAAAAPFPVAAPVPEAPQVPRYAYRFPARSAPGNRSAGAATRQRDDGSRRGRAGWSKEPREGEIRFGSTIASGCELTIVSGLVPLPTQTSTRQPLSSSFDRTTTARSARPRRGAAALRHCGLFTSRRQPRFLACPL